MENEDRFIDLEVKVSHQDDMLDALNLTVYEQGRRIEQLEAMLKQLAEQLRNLQHSGPGTLPHEKPPHY